MSEDQEGMASRSQPCADAQERSPEARHSDEDWGWWAGRDEEWFNYGGPFKTREEAISAGREDADGEAFCITEARQHRVRFSAARLIEEQYFDQEDLFDGDYGEPDRLGDHKAADAELQELLDRWAERHQATFVAPNLFASQRNMEWIEPETEPPSIGAQPSEAARERSEHSTAAGSGAAPAAKHREEQ